ncbi:hypothetical protein J2T57_001557 [Natronocella acetinitrilica]|uniref:Uncharacterized protein n=1 Tax=Natronocella acetinitrilica TaxID=414046 RepID=A0AAE3G274_9GAMM|nr:hypothetical protein [Natronocella acetinitrilica]MCP1674455.1 hypothetical protein [Natronocella acetinitrilica]
MQNTDSNIPTYAEMDAIMRAARREQARVLRALAIRAWRAFARRTPVDRAAPAVVLTPARVIPVGAIEAARRAA